MIDGTTGRPLSVDGINYSNIGDYYDNENHTHIAHHRIGDIHRMFEHAAQDCKNRAGSSAIASHTDTARFRSAKFIFL
jgi:hypothetical protein